MSVGETVSLRAKLALSRGNVSRLTHVLVALERQRAQADLIGWVALRQSFEFDIKQGEALLSQARAAQRGADIRGRA